MDTEEYSDEQLNFFRLCHIFTDEVAGSLRLFFKQEWDRRHKGKWKDGRKYGQKFKRRESGENQEKNKENLKIMVKGNTAEWDCTKLFYAICYSDCIGRKLRTAHKKALEKLRKARNKFYAHVPRGMIESAEFEFIVKEIENALLNLGLSTRNIRVIRKQTSFPTKELNKVLAKVKSLEQEVKVLEAQLNKDVSSFCVLPPKPFHDVVDRDREVAKIAKQLEELKEANENRLSYLYISGNPGSGKSQLAGLVAKRLFNEDTQIPFTASFVMTIDAKTPSTILKSYVELARKIKCPEYSITNTLNSSGLNSDEKIANLKSLIGSKIELYTTWLLVVDNVESISKINAYLPASGNEKWARGQLLITTQDTAHIPSVSSFVNHVSVSKGMEANDAVHLLKKVSGCSGYEREEVAQRLDYQPLALAKAAAYVRGVRDIEGGANFGWSDYLKKLKEGRTVASEKIVVDPVYPQSMGEVTRIAVKEAIKSTNVIIKNVFTLLFFCAPQPLSLEIVTNYIRNVAEEMGDKNAIRLQIQRCSLLLFHQEKNALFIKTHQVVHDAIRAVLKDYLKYDKLGAMKAAFMSFYQFVEDTQRDHLSFLDTFAKHSQCIPHIESLTTQIKDIFSVEETRNRVKIMFESDARCLETLGTICEEHFADQAAEDCFDIFLKIRPENLSPDDLDVGMAYSSLGGAQINLQKYEKAKESLDSALKIFKKLRPGDVIVGVTYSSLGDAHQILCDSIPAKQCYRRAISIFEKELTPDDYIVGETYSNLGNVLKDLGEAKEAKENYDRALPILLKKLRPGDAEVGMTYKNLGDVNYDLALPILQKELGPESYVVGKTLMELGKVPSELNQAKESYELALPIILREFGPEDCWIKMIKDRLVKIKQLQENVLRSSGSFGKRPNCSGHLGLVPAKRSKKK
ncbi:unnamed protein product [Pocillopora meandrina]|uniref:NB-ARC domain-containing protein n=1 Tax=Pocillopora meandrina TaxID=46732 RepID=A0AAU9XAD8_9CNID|nr:unnamed protein product [Pocillopora meandrina]